MTSTLEIQTQSEFLAFIKDEAMANGNLSIRGVARCCDVRDTSLIRGAALKSNKLSEMLSGKGFNAAALTEDGFPPQAVWICIEYFAYVSQAEAPMAKQLARTFGSIGVMTTLSQLTGNPAMPETQPIVSPLDAQIQRAIALAGGGGALAIEAFKLLHGITAPSSPGPKPTSPTTPTSPPPVPSKAVQDAESRELVKGFMRDIQTLLDSGILGAWDVSNITQNFKPCTAIVFKSVIPLLEAHFSYQIDRVRLEAAIVNLGGKGAQNQRFEPESSAKRNGQRSIVRKCIVIPAAMI